MIPDPPKALTDSKRQILDHLKSSGASDARGLADALGLTDMAVRQHLHALADDGLVAYEEERRGKGRPVRLWSLTPLAEPYFPDGHSQLAVQLVQSMRSAFGADGMQQLLAARRRALTAGYQAAIGEKADLAERLATLVDLRSAEGYMAELQPQDDGSYLLVENHCPICAAASACQGFCQVELDVFRDALGGDVSVERQDHILAGARRCAYRISESA